MRANPVISCVTLVGLTTVVADQATKIAATAFAGGQRSEAVIPLHNHEFSLGVAHASWPIMIVVMVRGYRRIR